MNIKTILDECAHIVNDRGPKYGPIETHFDVAARLATLKLNLNITPYMVVTIMESVKDARLAHDATHMDSHLDGVNYRAMRAAFAPKPKPEIKAVAPTPDAALEAIDADIANIAAKYGPRKDRG